MHSTSAELLELQGTVGGFARTSDYGLLDFYTKVSGPTRIANSAARGTDDGVLWQVGIQLGCAPESMLPPGL